MGSLEDTLLNIEKTFGAGSVMRLDSAPQNVDTISTGSTALDIATGIGGLPVGRIIEVYGPEASGKTTLALHIVAEAQKQGKAAYIDVEHALDPDYAEAIGVDTHDLYVSQPDSAEEALEIVRLMADSGEVAVVVVDSVAALTPRVELQGEIGEQNVGLTPRLMAQAMRKLVPICWDNKTTIVFINQLREQIGVFFGSPERTPGGRALKHAAAMRIDIRGKKEPDKQRCKATIRKNKLAPPFQTAEFFIEYGKGIRDIRKKKVS